MWAVLPLLTPWRGDMRRNSQPYYIGHNASMTEYSFALYVRQVLESRGVRCYVEVLGD